VTSERRHGDGVTLIRSLS